MTIREKIDAGYYNSKIPFDLPDDNIDEASISVAEYKKLQASRLYRVQENRRLFREDTNRLEMEVFREDLAKEHDLVGHPKADLLFSIAWVHGHSSGLIEVAQYYDEFADLLKL